MPEAVDSRRKQPVPRVAVELSGFPEGVTRLAREFDPRIEFEICAFVIVTPRASA